MPTWEEELAGLGGAAGSVPSWEDELASLGGDMPQVGVTLEGLDADAAASDNPADVYAAREGFKPFDGSFAPGSKGGFSGSNTAGQVQWGEDEDPLDALAQGVGDFGQHAAMSATMGWGDEAVGLFSPERAEAIRARQDLASERSPGWSLAGDVAGAGAMGLGTGALAAGATRALPFAGRLAAGAGLGGEQAAASAAGYAGEGWRMDAATDPTQVVPGMAFGAGGEMVGEGFEAAGDFARNKAAPWMREQGLLNRVASTGRPMPQLSKELGGRDGMLEAGQWMEDQGITQFTPQGVDDNLRDFTSMRRGDQRNFLDERAADPNAYPVNTGAVSQDLFDSAANTGGLAEQGMQTQAGQYLGAGERLNAAAPSGEMSFEQAWDQRKGFDKGGQWQQGIGGDKGLGEVNRDAANGLRGAMSESLDNTAPGLAPRWDGIQSDLHNSIGLSGGGDAQAVRDFGGSVAPFSVRSMASAAGGGPLAWAGAAATQMGGRSGLASAEKGGAAALDWLSQQAPLGEMSRAGGQTAAQQQDNVQDASTHSRGYLMKDAAFQMMQQRGALGPYEKQFWEAAESPSGKGEDAVVELVRRLSRTDQRFQDVYLPKLQGLTAGM